MTDEINLLTKKTNILKEDAGTGNLQFHTPVIETNINEDDYNYDEKNYLKQSRKIPGGLNYDEDSQTTV